MKPYTATDYEVRAFLEGRKTQFGVPVGPQPPETHTFYAFFLRDGELFIGFYSSASHLTARKVPYRPWDANPWVWRFDVKVV